MQFKVLFCFFPEVIDSNKEKVLFASPVKIIHLPQMNVVFNIFTFWHFKVLKRNPGLSFN